MQNRIFHLLQLSTISVCLGRGWQHLTKGGPYNSFFLNDYIFQQPIEFFGGNWRAFGTSKSVLQALEYLEIGIGSWLIIAAVVALFLPKINPRRGQFSLQLTTLFLLFLAICLFFAKGWRWGQLFEHSSQIAAPFLLLIHAKISEKRLLFYLKIAIALTFFCHGLYAIGYYGQPGFFVDMMIQGFGMQEASAKYWLWWAGFVDILIAFLLFVPLRFLQISALLYAFIWGGMTAFARLVANYYPDIAWYAIQQWLPETLFRFPHFLLPLVGLLLMFKKQE